MLHCKDTCYSWTELNTNNSKIGPWFRDLLGVQFKCLCSFFLGLSATIRSPKQQSFQKPHIKRNMDFRKVGSEFSIRFWFQCHGMSMTRKIPNPNLAWSNLATVKNWPYRHVSTNSCPSGRIRQEHNSTSYDNFCTMNLNSSRISAVRGHAPYKYPPRITMLKSPLHKKPARISWNDTSGLKHSHTFYTTSQSSSLGLLYHVLFKRDQ